MVNQDKKILTRKEDKTNQVDMLRRQEEKARLQKPRARTT